MNQWESTLRVLVSLSYLIGYRLPSGKITEFGFTALLAVFFALICSHLCMIILKLPFTLINDFKLY